MRTVYEFSVKDRKGKDVSLKEYANEVLLIVNTATKCGFTPQYEELEKLYETYHSQGFEILDFPCNQFGGQEPGGEKEISEGCLINYGVSFPMFSKIDVNGENAHPIYKYLKNELKGFPGSEIKWNFGKFMLDRNGKPYKRFSPFTKPEKLRKDIEKLLAK